MRSQMLVAEEVLSVDEEVGSDVGYFIDKFSLDVLINNLGDLSLLHKLLKGNLSAERVSVLLDELAQKTDYPSTTLTLSDHAAA